MTCQLSVIIPALNESGNITNLIEKIKSRISTLTASYEIIVIDGGSRDGTQELAMTAGARVILQKTKGYGSALKEAFACASGDYFITMDADFSHDPFFIQEMWQKKHQAAAIIASRYISCGSSNASWFRSCLSKFLNHIFSLVLNIPIKDFSSGFRMYKKEALKNITLESSTYDLLEELVVKIFCQGYTILEIPFHYSARHYGRSKARILTLGPKYCKVLFHMWKLRNSIQSADYDSRAYDSRIFFQRWWQRQRYAIIQDLVKDVTGHVIDIGCGSSNIIQNITWLVGLDIRMNKLRYVHHKNSKLIQADSCSLPVKNETFDGIICSQVIEHIPQEKKVIPELNRILKKGGMLILGTPDYGTRWWNIIEFFYKLLLPNAYGDEHITHYTFKSIEALLKKHYFEIIEYRYLAGAELVVKARKT